MRVSLLVAICFIGLAECGYRRHYVKRSLGGGDCNNHLDNLSKEEFEEIFQKLLTDLGEEDKDAKNNGNGKSVSIDERRDLLKNAIEHLLEVENDEDSTYSLGLNKFSIMTADELSTRTGVNVDEEYKHMRRRVRLQNKRRKAHKLQDTTAPPSKVNHCAVTGPVEDQGDCGSCWAFAASHALGGRLRLRDGGDTVYRLSEQQMNDCTYNHTGCDGGHSFHAWKHVGENKASTDFKYPYNGIYNGNGKCASTEGRMELYLGATENYDGKEETVYFDWLEVASGATINDIKNTVAEGPVVVYMHVGDTYDWGSTTQGVYEPKNAAECEQEDINHAMVICGYDKDAATGKEFWMVKNSWGTSWGDNGLVRALTVKNSENQFNKDLSSYIKVALGKNICSAENNIIIPKLQTGKKSDTSAVCVNGKSCSSDADCNNIQGACDASQSICSCNLCKQDVVCTSDDDCGGQTGACKPQARRRFSRQVSDNDNRCECGSGGEGGAQTTTIGSDETTTETYGSSTDSSDGSGSSTDSSDGYGSSTDSSDGYGSSTEGSDGYGSSTEGSDRYGSSTDSSDGYGSSTDSSDGYGSSTDSSDGYGSSTDSNDEYGSSTDSNDGYGSSTDSSDGYGSSTDSSDGDGSSTDSSDGYGSSTEGGCRDQDPICTEWAADGDCKKGRWKKLMRQDCPKACGFC